MNEFEYFSAKKNLIYQLDLVKKLSKADSDFEKQLFKLIEMLITVKGHAWCMDVKTERRKMAKLMVGLLKQI